MMSPRRIVERALETGLDMIAVCDHNAADNAAAAMRAAAGTALKVFPGLEITTEEEVHLLAVFETMDEIRPVAEAVTARLPVIRADKTFLRDQILVNEADEVIGFHPHFLMGATSLPLDELVGLIHAHGGLAFAAHIDRPAFGLLSQLGFVPPGLNLDALEVSPQMTPARARTALHPPSFLPLLTFSDAHRPEDIGARTTDFLLAASRLDEIRLALAGRDGRKILTP